MRSSKKRRARPLYQVGLLLSVLLTPLSASAECVVLLHGLARSHNSMQYLAEELGKLDYFVVNVDYPSRKQNLAQLADTYVAKSVASCPSQEKVHFVTHSMGGILVRQYLSNHTLDRLGRVVMLGPPNQGSEVVDKLGDFPGFHFINGDAGLELGTGKFSTPNALGAANFELGIIAGSRSINLMLSAIIPGDDDGKVAVERTKLDGMDDHLVLPVTHPFMMKNERVIQQVLYFLKHGEFQRDEKNAEHAEERVDTSELPQGHRVEEDKEAIIESPPSNQ